MARAALITAVSLSLLSVLSAQPGACGNQRPGIYSRCAANPLKHAGFRHNDSQLFEVSIGDPDVHFDTIAGIWRLYFSTGLAATYFGNNSLVIKSARSADGIEWNVDVDPALLNSSNWDSDAVETPTVVRMPPGGSLERTFLMLYSGGKKTSQHPYTWYQMGAAFSRDGVSFSRISASESPYGMPGLALMGRDAFPGLSGVADGLVADPDLIVDSAGVIHAFFSSLAVDSKGNPLAYGIGHATSTDGAHWISAALNPFFSGGAGPSIISVGPASYSLFYYQDTDADKAGIPSTFNPQLGEFEVTAPSLTGPWTPMAGAGIGGRAVSWNGSFAYESLGWVATGDMAAGVPAPGERRWYYVAFDTTASDVPDGFVAPTHTGLQPAVIALSVMVRVT